MRPQVVVADATPFLRMAIRKALVADGIVVRAEVACAEDAVRAVGELGADLVLLGAELDPEMRAVRRMAAMAPPVSVLVLSPDASEASALAAVRAGACGLVLKETQPERLPAIVRGVLAGEAAIPRRLMRALLGHIRDGAVTGEAERGLSAREREVLELLCAGAEDRAVAARLQIAEVTVRRHAAAAARKLDARDRAHALVLFRARRGEGISSERMFGVVS